jgi:hypothetical protein
MRRPSDRSMKPAAAFRLTLTVALVALLAACATSRFGQDASDEADGRADATANPAQSPVSESPFPSRALVELQPGGADAPDGVADEVWAMILEALEARLGDVDPSGVTVVSAEQVTWNDGSLGCPEPGGVYTQALVDGLRVVVEVDGEEYDYRIPNGGEPQLCESPLPRGG